MTLHADGHNILPESASSALVPDRTHREPDKVSHQSHPDSVTPTIHFLDGLDDLEFDSEFDSEDDLDPDQIIGSGADPDLIDTGQGHGGIQMH